MQQTAGDETKTNFFLLRCYSEAKLRNPSFTLRAFARRLHLSSGALSELMRGKRKLTEQMANRIAEVLGLSPEEKIQLLHGNRFDAQAKKLSSDQFNLIAEWQHFGILSLMETKGFRNDAAWIAGRLGLSVTEVNQAMKRLAQLELIEWSPTECKRRHRRIFTNDDIPDASLKLAHIQELELARHALEGCSVGTRDFTSVTMAIDVGQLPRAKELIREFQDRLMELLEESPRTEVYKLCIQLFPVSKSFPGDKEGSPP